VGGSSALDLPAALLVGLGYAFPWPALASVVVGLVPVSERAVALGALTAFYDLFVAGSSAVAGAVAGHWGLASVFWLAFASMWGAVILLLTTGLGAKKPAAQECESVASFTS
jgi:MFS family permease